MGVDSRPPVKVIPLDPDSDKGREVAERINQVLAEIRVEIEEREAAEARRMLSD